jgi:serine/threonine protein kinase
MASDPSSPVGTYPFLAAPAHPGELGRLGPYRVFKVRGAGSMGIVFEAEDPQLQRWVALKVLPPVLALDPVARRRFLREARAAAALEHDHIVHIYEVAEDRGVPYLAMALLRGETLDARLEREGTLPITDIVRIGRESAAGLAAAHERGLIHRDIKPANIFLEGARDEGQRTGQARPSSLTSRVKILDFGLVRAAANDESLSQCALTSVMVSAISVKSHGVRPSRESTANTTRSSLATVW